MLKLTEAGPEVGPVNQSDIAISFERPKVAVNLSVRIVVAGSKKPISEYVVHYFPPHTSASASASSHTPTSRDSNGISGGTSSAAAAAGGGGVTSVSVNGGEPVVLKLSPSDKTIDLRLFVDNVLSEIYFMNGYECDNCPPSPPPKKKKERKKEGVSFCFFFWLG